MLGAVGSNTEVQSSLDEMLQNIVTSSAIEGEQLNVGSVRSSLARRLGLNEEGRTTSSSEGLAEFPARCHPRASTTAGRTATIRLAPLVIPQR